jgi:hypothetical protein
MASMDANPMVSISPHALGMGGAPESSVPPRGVGGRELDVGPGSVEQQKQLPVCPLSRLWQALLPASPTEPCIMSPLTRSTLVSWANAPISWPKPAASGQVGAGDADHNLGQRSEVRGARHGDMWWGGRAGLGPDDGKKSYWSKVLCKARVAMYNLQATLSEA